MADSTVTQELPPNPLMSEVKLEAPGLAQPEVENTNPQKLPHELDSAVTKAEKFECHGFTDDNNESPSKRIKLNHVDCADESSNGLSKSERQKGIAPIKAEFLVCPPGSKQDRGATIADDDTAEAASHGGQTSNRNDNKRDKKRGQNTARSFGSSREEVTLCQSRAHSSEFSPDECRFGEKCKYEHNLRKYLSERKRGDLVTFGGVCPVWRSNGKCGAGWKCRFVGSHMHEKDVEGGRKELILTEEASLIPSNQDKNNQENGTVNNVPTQAKIDLLKRRIKTPKADAYSQWLDTNSKEVDDRSRLKGNYTRTHEDSVDSNVESNGTIHDNRALYSEPPFMPSEKRRIYFGPETPVLAPLTTQGNLPFRRLCISLGAQVTYSEMAMSLPLIQGTKAEWALMRAHQSETLPPRFDGRTSVVEAYNNMKDSKFGAQISANKPWQALKATEIMTSLCPQLRVIDLNCGCPIDLVYRSGAGSALLNSQAKLEKMLRGMNAVSGEIPITVKIRMGTKDSKPNAEKLVDRLVNGGNEALEAGQGPAGIAAITLHGRSRQQRYTKNADWSYISDCAALIRRYNERRDDLSDTVKEADIRSQPSRVYFLGNGDCYSHVDYYQHMKEAKVDSVMIARGALIKPWIFEEIEQGQYLDKSASERLALVEQFVRYGLETWGSDEMGVGTTRRFLLEWLSFAYRYVPVGILEHLPPSLQDRPPAWRGRNDLETLLGSDNYKDWIKISEMFLGPAHENFRFEPKHKSNSYEIEGEG